MNTGFGHEERGAEAEKLRRLFVFNGGFLRQQRLRRILHLAGWQVRLGLPGAQDWVGIWGNSPTAHRGKAIAERRRSPLLRIEDPWVRSIQTGRDGEPPLGLMLDTKGVHFDPSTPSDLEDILARHPLDDAALLTRAKVAIERMQRLDISKYNAFQPRLPLPDPGYVLVIDQTEGDAAVRASGADRARFVEMLAHAQSDHPDAQILIKSHPETMAGHRGGYFRPEDAGGRVSFMDLPVSPWRLLEGARAVYTVSSQFGFEAIFAGLKPNVFGQPFYAGWGLTHDDQPIARRTRTLTRAQLFATAVLLYPKWYDPYRDALCTFETVLDTLEARTRAFRQDRQGYVAVGMRLWKRGPLQQMFGQQTPLRFSKTGPGAIRDALDKKRPIMVWAGKSTPALEASAKAANLHLFRVEDGFLRSKGLGADLVPPLSLVLDDLGIYYDPTRPSRLEHLIQASPDLTKAQIHRAEALTLSLIRAGLSKYNLAKAAPADLPAGHRILVPGQVEDDASIRLGCTDTTSNLDLLRKTRAANPDAVILFKPHPDVEAGLRPGAIPEQDALIHADRIVTNADPVQLIGQVQEVWTMTSLLGFEALLRGVSVTCLGVPFYAGWGLTADLTPTPERRRARPTLAMLAHAALIDYPRYHDPVTGTACPVEVAVERLVSGQIPRPGPANRLLAKVQGALAGIAPFWR